MHLLSNLTSEICQKGGGLDGKTKQNSLEVSTFHLFLRKPLYLLKNDKRLSIFYCKNKCAYKFYVFTIKSSYGNMSVSSELRFEKILKTKFAFKVHIKVIKKKLIKELETK